MRYLRILFFTICATLLECTFICAQESNDYYKFDDRGVLVEFLHTTPDGVKISYAYHNYAYGPTDRMGLITYPDGTQIDYSESISTLWEAPVIITHHVHEEDPYDRFYYIKNWYKDLRKVTSVPTGAAMLDGMLGLTEYLIIFPDNSQVVANYSNKERRLKGYTDVSENGDLFNQSKVNVYNPKLIDSETLQLMHNERMCSSHPEFAENKEKIRSRLALSKTAKLAVGKIVDFNLWDGGLYYKLYVIYEGKVFLEDGSTFIGKFHVILEGADPPLAQPKSSYLKSLFDTNPMYGINDIAGVAIKDGYIVNKENEIVAIYRDSKQLDEFDMASELAAMQGRVDREIAAAKKAASERAAITSKYGQKYANAFFAGDVVVGMPWSLVQIGLDAHSFKRFYTVFLSVEHQTAGGTIKKYSLISSGFARVGSMWVSNGTVQSITYY